MNTSDLFPRMCQSGQINHRSESAIHDFLI